MWQVIKNRLIGKKPTVSRAEVMASRPVRNSQVVWERVPPSGIAKPDEGEAAASARADVMLLKIPRRKDKMGNVIARVFKLPDYRKLELDEIGSDVWEMCDGETTVEVLTKAVCAKWQMNRRQGETSVTAYLRMLAERRLIAVRTGSKAGVKAGTAKNKTGTRRGTTPARKQGRA